MLYTTGDAVGIAKKSTIADNISMDKPKPKLFLELWTLNSTEVPNAIYTGYRQNFNSEYF